jgi:hypothetical protein
MRKFILCGRLDWPLDQTRKHRSELVLRVFLNQKKQHKLNDLRII